MTTVLRERRPEDLPALVALLGAQQAASSYPVRWPLPVPVEDFLVRATELRAWVAVEDDEIVGHVTVAAVDEPLVEAFATATGTSDLAMVSVLFTGAATRGRGVGGLLLDTAVDWIRGLDRVPVLDVIPVHATALAIYLRRGWVEIGRSRFEWLAPDFPDVTLMALPPYPGPSRTSSTSP